MADKPKVSRITVRVGGVDPVIDKEVVVIATLENGSIPLIPENDLVLYIYPDDNDKKTLRYPSVGDSLIWCQLPSGSDYYFCADEKFFPPNAAGNYPYSFIKMTYSSYPLTGDNIFPFCTS